MAMQATTPGHAAPEGTGAGAALARGLGWFSVGLGLAEVSAPRSLARAIGIQDGRRTRDALIALGVRELAHGVGILTHRSRRPAWVWSRVVGDVLDLALIGLAFRTRRKDSTRLVAATVGLLGVTALDLLASRKLARGAQEETRMVQAVLTINRPPEEVESRWQGFVQRRGPASFRAAPGGRGTEVRISATVGELRADASGVEKLVAGLAPREQLMNELRRFKQQVEAGEVVHSDASIHPGTHAAQPPGRAPTATKGNRR